MALIRYDAATARSVGLKLIHDGPDYAEDPFGMSMVMPDTIRDGDNVWAHIDFANSFADGRLEINMEPIGENQYLIIAKSDDNQPMVLSVHDTKDEDHRNDGSNYAHWRPGTD